MKILAIRGRNLASLRGDFAVDLAAEPFVSAGLFAITGATGSGKSTLLDALCLALFDRTPRLDNRGGSLVGRADEEAVRRLRAGDVRGLLTRGTAGGHAEVDFSGLDGRRWRARWEVRRARGKATGRLQPQSLSLESLDGGDRVGGNKTEVLEAIRRRIGLTFDQFRRSVLLAQGDFAAFLHAKASERAELLEKVTGTAIYARLSQAAFERAKAEREALDALRLRSEALGVLTAEERQTLEDEHGRVSAELDAARKALEAAELAMRWYTELARLAEREGEGETSLTTAEGAWKAATERRQILEAIRQAQPLRPKLERWERASERQEGAKQQVAEASDGLEEARERLATTEAALAGAREDESAAKGAFQAAKSDLEKATLLDDRLGTARGQADASAEAVRSAAAVARELAAAAATVEQQVEEREVELRQAEAWLEAHPAAETLAGAWKPIEAALGDHARATTDVTAAREALPALEASAEKARQGVDETEQQAEVKRLSLDSRQEEVDAAEAAIPEGRRQELEGEQEEARGVRRLLRRVEETLAEAERLEGERQKAATAEQAAREKEAAAHRDVGETEGALAALEIRLGEAEHALASSRALRDLDSRRSDLIEGEPCPLCGSPDHPWGHDSAPDPELEARQQRVDELGAEGRGLTSRLADARARAEAAADEAEGQAGQRSGCEERLEAPRRGWATLCGSLASADPPILVLPEDPLGEGVASRVEEEVARAEQQLDGLGERLRQLGELEARAQGCRRARDEARKTHDAGTAARDAARETHRQVADALADGRRQLDDAEVRGRRALESLAASLPDTPGWRIGWEEALGADPEAFARSCRQEVESYERQSAARKKTGEALETLRPRAAEAAEKGRAASQAVAEKEGERDKNLARVEALVGERATLLDDRPVAEVRHELDEAVRAAEQGLDTALKEEQAARSAFQVAESQLRSARGQLGQEAGEVEKAKDTLDTALTELGSDLDTLRRRLEHDAAWCEQEGQTLDALELAVRDARKILEERRERRQEHEQEGRPEISAEEADERQGQAAEAHREVEEKARQLEVRLGSDDAARAKAAALAGEIAEQEAESHRWAQLGEVIGSHDGSKFRRFAQGLTLDSLLGHANAHLRDLAPRYHLQRIPGEDLELQVIDLDMGDEVRSINSLSGGETFLTSLALALGLSSLSASDMPVESLFIDEGFGTLDPQSLEVALAAFDALQATGRQIGIISHVRDLDERVGVQLRVVKLGAGHSRLEVVGGAVVRVPV